MIEMVIISCESLSMTNFSVSMNPIRMQMQIMNE